MTRPPFAAAELIPTDRIRSALMASRRLPWSRPPSSRTWRHKGSRSSHQMAVCPKQRPSAPNRGRSDPYQHNSPIPRENTDQRDTAISSHISLPVPPGVPHRTQQPVLRQKRELRRSPLRLLGSPQTAGRSSAIHRSHQSGPFTSLRRPQLSKAQCHRAVTLGLIRSRRRQMKGGYDGSDGDGIEEAHTT